MMFDRVFTDFVMLGDLPIGIVWFRLPFSILLADLVLQWQEPVRPL
jgi:hypothetical protein